MTPSSSGASSSEDNNCHPVSVMCIDDLLPDLYICKYIMIGITGRRVDRQGQQVVVARVIALRRATTDVNLCDYKTTNVNTCSCRAGYVRKILNFTYSMFPPPHPSVHGGGC
jgi:hypothetical protein